MHNKVTNIYDKTHTIRLFANDTTTIRQRLFAPLLIEDYRKSNFNRGFTARKTANCSRNMRWLFLQQPRFGVAVLHGSHNFRVLPSMCEMPCKGER